MNIHATIFLPFAFSLIASTVVAADGQFSVDSNLQAGVAKVDITPAETDGVMVTGHRRKIFGVRDRLRAGVLILNDGETKAAIVTLDTIGAWDEMVQLARERIEKLTGVPYSELSQQLSSCLELLSSPQR